MSSAEIYHREMACQATNPCSDGPSKQDSQDVIARTEQTLHQLNAIYGLEVM